jgi:hypothetical protein
MATRKMSKRQMDDHDDAHFDGNPAFKPAKRGGKKAAARGKKRGGRKSSKR